MRDEHHRAFEAGKGVGEHPLRAHVEMVGRLVQHEKVGRPKQHFQQQQAASLAAAQYVYPLEYLFAPEEKRAEHPAETGNELGGSVLLDFFENTVVGTHGIRSFLREVGGFHAGAESDRAAVLVVFAG